MYIALIKNNLVDAITEGDAAFLSYAATQYDGAIDVTDTDPRPQPGDSYYARVGAFVSNAAIYTPLNNLELASLLAQGTLDGFAPFNLSSYSVSYADGIVTIGCKQYGARGLLQALYEVLQEHKTDVADFTTNDDGPAHGKFGITWDDAQMLYDALVQVNLPEDT